MIQFNPPKSVGIQQNVLVLAAAKCIMRVI